MVIELIAVEYGWPLGVVDEPRPAALEEKGGLG